MVTRTAPAQYPILSVIGDRWSPVAFASRPVEAEKLNSLFEAARWAASCNNAQPWYFVIAHQGTDGFTKMAGCLMDGNLWAKSAPILVLSVANMMFTYNGKPNRTAMYDAGMAVGNMLAQATADGLVVHQMAGYDVEKARQALELPADHEPLAMMAIGYYGNHATLDEKYRMREESPRVRRPASEFVFAGKWGG